MNASKEEAKKAKEVVDEIRLNLDLTQKGYNCWPDIIVGLDKIESFIEATERKLPSEKSYEREKQRKRTKKEPVNVYKHPTTYHEPSHAHPASCPGCNSDKSFWGQPIKERKNNAQVNQEETRPVEEAKQPVDSTEFLKSYKSHPQNES